MSIFILRAISWPEGNGKPSWDEERSWFPEQLLKSLPLFRLEGGMLLAPAVWMDLEGKKRKPNKKSLAFCSEPKPKDLQAGKAISGSPYSKEEQWDAHRRAPMFHNHIGAPREMQFGLTQCGTVWRSHHRHLSPQSCVTQLHGAFKAALTFWALRAVSSRRCCKKNIYQL